jgi:hypothetical protein
MGGLHVCAGPAACCHHHGPLAIGCHSGCFQQYGCQERVHPGHQAGSVEAAAALAAMPPGVMRHLSCVMCHVLDTECHMWAVTHDKHATTCCGIGSLPGCRPQQPPLQGLQHCCMQSPVSQSGQGPPGMAYQLESPQSKCMVGMQLVAQS